MRRRSGCAAPTFPSPPAVAGGEEVGGRCAFVHVAQSLPAQKKTPRASPHPISRRERGNERCSYNAGVSGTKRGAAWKWIAGALFVAALVAAGRLLPLREAVQGFQIWIAGLGALGMLLFAAVYVASGLLLGPTWLQGG